MISYHIEFYSGSKTLEEFVSGADDKKSLRIRVWKNETKINSIPALMLICQALMGLSFEYQLFNGNCENFANFVYSGLDVCSQTKLFGKLHKGRVGSFKEGAVGTMHEFYAEKYDASPHANVAEAQNACYQNKHVLK